MWQALYLIQPHRLTAADVACMVALSAVMAVVPLLAKVRTTCPCQTLCWGNMPELLRGQVCRALKDLQSKMHCSKGFDAENLLNNTLEFIKHSHYELCCPCAGRRHDDRRTRGDADQGSLRAGRRGQGRRPPGRARLQPRGSGGRGRGHSPLRAALRHHLQPHSRPRHRQVRADLELSRSRSNSIFSHRRHDLPLWLQVRAETSAAGPPLSLSMFVHWCRCRPDSA